jgi:hypothetical protein
VVRDSSLPLSLLNYPYVLCNKYFFFFLYLCPSPRICSNKHPDVTNCFSPFSLLSLQPTFRILTTQHSILMLFLISLVRQYFYSNIRNGNVTGNYLPYITVKVLFLGFKPALQIIYCRLNPSMFINSIYYVNRNRFK